MRPSLRIMSTKREQTARQTDRQTDGKMDKQTDGQMDGWMDRQTDRQGEKIYPQTSLAGGINKFDQLDTHTNMNRHIDRHIVQV